MSSPIVEKEVVFVEDEPSIRSLEGEIFSENNDAHVILVENARDALAIPAQEIQILKENPGRVLILFLDYNYFGSGWENGINGEIIARKMHELATEMGVRDRLCIIGCSARPQQWKRCENEMVIQRILAKPFEDIYELIHLVEEPPLGVSGSRRVMSSVDPENLQNAAST